MSHKVKGWRLNMFLLCLAYNKIITRTNKCSICLQRTHELFFSRDIWQFRRRVRYPYQNNECILHSWIEHEFVVVFIAYYTFDVDLMDLYRFTFGTILCKNVVQTMWSPFRDHIVWYHKLYYIIISVLWSQVYKQLVMYWFGWINVGQSISDFSGKCISDHVFMEA